MLAESPRVPWTRARPQIRIDMLIDALGVAALAILCKEPAFGHPFQVVLVQEFTQIALLTQSPQPVLTDDRLFGGESGCGCGCVSVSVGAARASGANGPSDEEGAVVGGTDGIDIDTDGLLYKGVIFKVYLGQQTFRSQESVSHGKVAPL